MLYFRCKDLQWLKTKLQTHVVDDIQWTSPEIQNELIQIVSSLGLQRMITRDIKSNGHYSMINVDETSGISSLEQVSLCLRYVVERDTRDGWRIFCD